MAAHRYWRVCAFLLPASAGGIISISEVRLLDSGGIADGGLVPSSSVPPVAGLLSALVDGSAAAVVSLAQQTTLTWDFGESPVSVTDVRLGSGEIAANFPAGLSVQWSDDGASWVQEPYLVFAAPQWPGPFSFTASSAPQDIRFLVFATNGDAKYVSVQEAEIRGAVGGADLTTPSSPAFDSSHYGSRSADKAFDGITTGDNNNWTSSGDPLPQWFGVSLSAPSEIAELTILPEDEPGGIGYRRAPRDFAVQCRRNGGPWYTVAEFFGVDSWVNATVKTFAISARRRMHTGIDASGFDVSFCASDGATPTMSGACSFPAAGLRPNFMFDPAANGRIDGTVKRKSDPTNIPLRRRVRLYRDIDGMLIAETWSDATGHFSFDFVESNWTYTAIAFDYERNYRAVLADNLTPGVMP